MSTGQKKQTKTKTEEVTKTKKSDDKKPGTNSGKVDTKTNSPGGSPKTNGSDKKPKREPHDGSKEDKVTAKKGSTTTDGKDSGKKNVKDANNKEPKDNNKEPKDNNKEPKDNHKEPKENNKEPKDNHKEPKDNHKGPRKGSKESPKVPKMNLDLTTGGKSSPTKPSIKVPPIGGGKVPNISFTMPKKEEDPLPADSSLLVAPGQKVTNERVIGISKRLISGYADTVGGRKSMEDKLVIFGDFPAQELKEQNADYFAVFDGHNGSECASLCALELHNFLEKNLNPKKNITQSLKTAFLECNQSLKKVEQGGTTAVVALFLEKELWVANAGDSRAVLCRNRKAYRVTVDHKPHLPQERERIVRQGGTVIKGKVDGSLTVARALGDNPYRGRVSCEPDVFGPFSFLDPEFQLLILACDGLWDVVDDEEAVLLALQCNDPQEAAVKLRETARQKYSQDNISVLVIFCPSYKTPILTSSVPTASTATGSNNTTNAASTPTGKPEKSPGKSGGNPTSGIRKSGNSSPPSSTKVTTSATFAKSPVSAQTPPGQSVPQINLPKKYQPQQTRVNSKQKDEEADSEEVVRSSSEEDEEEEDEEEDDEEDEDDDEDDEDDEDEDDDDDN